MLSAFGRPYLSYVFVLEPDALSGDGVLEAFRLEGARRFGNPCRGPCFVASVQRDVHQEFRDYSEVFELLWGAEHLIKKELSGLFFR